jgi:hypothetical protein
VLIQKQIASKKATEAELKAERERSARAIVDAQMEEIEAKVAREKQRLADDEKKRNDREVKRKLAQKEWEANAPLRAADKQAAALQERRDKAAKEAARASYVKSIVDRIGRAFRDDALYADMKAMRIGKTNAFPTLTECKRLKEALLDASVRFREEAGKW